MEEVPFDDRHVPRVEVDWSRSLWWWYPLTRAIHPAMRITSLGLSLIGILLVQAGLRLGEWLFAPDWSPVIPDMVYVGLGGMSRLVVWAGDVVRSLLSFSDIGLQEIAFISFELLWLTLTFALLGGVLVRRGVVELGQRTIAPWGESIQVVFSRWHSYLWSTGMHLVGIAAMLVPALVLGFVSRWGSVGATIAGALLLLSFPLVFGIGRFALSMVLCFPLSVAAISTERKADAFEGFSRSNAYFFQRPVVAFLCAAGLLAVGWVGELIVSWTLTLGWGLVRSGYFFTGGETQPASNTYVGAGNWLAESLIAAYWFSFFWSATAAVYLVLRKSVDHTDLDEIDSPESAAERTLPDIPSSPTEGDTASTPAASGDPPPDSSTEEGTTS